MKHDDWKLTAYALGELEGEDHVQMELMVAQSPELQDEVAEIRAASGLLSRALVPFRTEGTDSAVSALALAVADDSSRFWNRRLRVPLASAAALAMCVGAYLLISSLSHSRERLASINADNIKSLGTSSKIYTSAEPIGWSIPEHPAPAAPQPRTTPSPTVAYNQATGEIVYSGPAAKISPALIESERPTGRERRRSAPRNFHQSSFATASAGQGTMSWIVLDNQTNFRNSEEELASALQSLGYFGAPIDPTSAERYSPIVENPFCLVDSEPLSTFSIDVDTASYANIRRFLNAGALPPPDAVRIEEMINYFDYAYPQPIDEHPFSVNLEIADCPWNAQHRLARIGIAGYELDPRERPAANLVFLIDVSGSMNTAGKLPLVQESLGLLIDQLDRRDSIAMVVYAGASGVVLEPTGGTHRELIRNAVYRLQAGGSTNGGAGIEAAYELASQNFIEGGINRVILATDGDFNVGLTGQGELQRLIEERAKSGVFLTVLGFGMGNLQDATLETLADKGNGNYAYIDTLNEAHKVLVEQMGGTLVTIAKDVKIQVEFNPLVVSAYRLLGYENRMLAAQDFNDDRKDAGEIGAGHTVTALYEIVPAGQQIDVPAVDDLKYQRLAETTPAAESGEMMTVKLRYKEPDGAASKLIEVPVTDTGATFVQSSDDFAFAAAVASFGMLLRGSAHAASLDYTSVAEMAQDALGDDAHGYRAEFLTLVRLAEQTSRETQPGGFTPVPAP